MLNKNISKSLIVISVLALFQAALRLYFSFATAGFLGQQQVDSVHGMISVAMTGADWAALATMFGLIGLVGLVSGLGLLLSTKWGAYGTLAISAVTIAYDVWAMFAIQATAAIGLVLPIVFIAYILVRRGRLLCGELRTVEGAGGVRN